MNAPTHRRNDAVPPYTASGITRFFGFFEPLDRLLYGRKIRFVCWSLFFVLVLAPLIDALLPLSDHCFTFWANSLLCLEMLVVSMAAMSTWRDDDNQWTLKRSLFRVRIFRELLRDVLGAKKSSCPKSFLYTLGKNLFLFALLWKTLQNVSVSVRHLLAPLGDWSFDELRNVERIIHNTYWFPLLAGVLLLFVVYRKNPRELKALKQAYRQFFTKTSSSHDKNYQPPLRANNSGPSELVINTQKKDQVHRLLEQSSSPLFADFMRALELWKGGDCQQEYQCVDQLYKHLRRTMPDVLVELDKPIGKPLTHSSGRADLVIQNNILIELKRDLSDHAVQQAKGEIMHYAHLWRHNGPVILLVCNDQYQQAKQFYTATMLDLFRLRRQVLTLVVA